MKSWKLGSPPRRRGKDKAEHLVQDHIGITPAQAGKRCYLCASTKSSWDHPRVGGEKAKITPRLKRCRGSPPRGRGKVVRPDVVAKAAGITPAWAGKSKLALCTPSCPTDHPRAGREKNKELEGVWLPMGSPPRRRGKERSTALVGTPTRITPALAGKSYVFGPFRPGSWDHPRVGGEKRFVRNRTQLRLGSPPRGRGKETLDTGRIRASRITPAWAGKRPPLWYASTAA